MNYSVVLLERPELGQLVVEDPDEALEDLVVALLPRAQALELRAEALLVEEIVEARELDVDPEGELAHHLMTPDTATVDPPFRRNFRGLVLGCMGTYDSESRRIFSHF